MHASFVIAASFVPPVAVIEGLIPPLAVHHTVAVHLTVPVMVGLSYSPQIKAAVKYDLECGRTDNDIAARHQVSKSTVYRYRKHWEEWGEVALEPLSHGGRPRALDLAHGMALLDYLNERPTAYLDEMRFFLYDAFDLLVDESTISRELRRLDFSRKKCRQVAAQRSQDLRDWWMQRLVGWRGNQLVYLDESASSERTGERPTGWAPIGDTPTLIRSLKRHKRWSILPAIALEGYIAYTIHQGSITTEIFNDFVRYQVLPLCSPVPGPRSVLVCDNHITHKSQELEDMCLEAGVELAFLPPYSPDLNPIETSFSILKAWIRRNFHLYEAGYEQNEEGFESFLHAAVASQNYGAIGDSVKLFKKAGVDIDA